jgi:hypothetical protein
MKTDFKNAYARHQQDADSLFDNKRYANADHLYGLAAECALKAVMLGLDPTIVDKNGDFLNASDKKHIDKLWDHFRLFLQGRNASSLLIHISSSNNPFHKWTINSRYSHQKTFNKGNVFPHKKTVNNSIANLMLEARIKGIL